MLHSILIKTYQNLNGIVLRETTQFYETHKSERGGGGLNLNSILTLLVDVCMQYALNMLNNHTEMRFFDELSSFIVDLYV